MDNNFFKVGDVVLLKGNERPKMTVTCIPPSINIEKWVDTAWFDGGTLIRGKFHQTTLDLFVFDEPEDER